MQWAYNRKKYRRSWQQVVGYHEQTEKTLLMQASNLADVFQSAEVIKDDKSTSVARLSQGPGYFIKRFNARSFGHVLKRAFRKSRAQCCWDMSFEFAHLGLNVAPAQLMYESRFGPLRGGGFFINQALEGEELLQCLPHMSEPEQNAAITQLRQAFAIMQEHRISHGDMKASNLLWCKGEIYFIDLDAAQKHRFDFTWKRAARRDKKRFLKNWREYPALLDKLDCI